LSVVLALSMDTKWPVVAGWLDRRMKLPAKALQ
jgi:hypothetical protein